MTRVTLNSARRCLSIGWFWAAVLLALPNCTLNRSGIADPHNLYAGPTPRADAIFCDIEKPLGRHCASDTEKMLGIALSEAAVALNEGRTSNIGLDYSADALTRCSGEPEAVEYQGSFPEGLPVCVNCGAVVGTVRYPDVNAACRARCYDFFGTTESDGTITPQNPPDLGVQAFCDSQAKASTNFPLDGCFSGACSAAGTLNPGFSDPRRAPEPVAWTDLVGTASGGTAGNDLTRTTATTTWDAGAASMQQITRGDAFVEFSALEVDKGHAAGFSHFSAPCGPPCVDGSAALDDIDFGLVLGNNGYVYVYESGVKVPGPDVDGSWGTYVSGERFRVHVTDKHNFTADVTYSRLVGTCTPGAMCNQAVLYTHAAAPAVYPLRVDASFSDQGATLSDVRLVRIQ